MVSRTLCIISMLMGSYYSTAQEQYIQPGLLASSLTYSPSKMLNHNQSNFYVNGFAEYFLDKNVSFRSDSYIFLNSESENPLMKNGIRGFFGMAYHLNKGNWDTHLGFQPGLVFMRDESSFLKSEVQPSAALRVGTSYYVWKYFHFFANLTYVKSKKLVRSRGSLQTDELIFSAGLGFQIQTKRRKK